MGVEFGRIFTDFYKKHSYAHLDILVRWITLIILFGIPAIALGTTVVPFNRQVWSISFTMLTVSCGGLLVALVFILLDVILWQPRPGKAIRMMSRPFVWIGRNPIAIYVLMMFQQIIIMNYLKVNDGTIYML
eukprot:gene16862-20047_t